MSAIIRLREVCKGKRTIWHAETWAGEKLVETAAFNARPPARRCASIMAYERNAVVVLVGPDRFPAPVVAVRLRSAVE